MYIYFEFVNIILGQLVGQVGKGRVGVEMEGRNECLGFKDPHRNLNVDDKIFLSEVFGVVGPF